MPFSIDFWTPKGSQKAPKIESQGVPKGVKRKSLKRTPSEGGPGPSWDPFWVDFGTILGRFWGDFFVSFLIYLRVLVLASV